MYVELYETLNVRYVEYIVFYNDSRRDGRKPTHVTERRGRLYLIHNMETLLYQIRLFVLKVIRQKYMMLFVDSLYLLMKSLNMISLSTGKCLI